MLVALALVLSLVDWTPPTAGASLRFSFHLTGRLECRGMAPGRSEGQVLLDCRLPDGTSALRVAFFGGERQFNGYIRLREIRPAGMPTPLLLAVAVTTGGSDSLFETALIGEVEGRVIDLWPRHWQTNILDDLCVGPLGPNKSIGVAAFTFTWGGDAGESHYAPHHYKMTLYQWQGSRFMLDGTQLTSRRGPPLTDAAKELGFRCRGELHSFWGLKAFR